jgi:ATP-dependent Zn protease
LPVSQIPTDPVNAPSSAPVSAPLPPAPQAVIDCLPAPTHKSNRRQHLFGWVFFIGLAVVFFLLMTRSSRRYPEIPLSDFQTQLLRGQVSWLWIEGDGVRGQLKSVPAGSTTTAFRTTLPPGMASNWQFVNWMLENSHGARIQVINSDNPLATVIVPLIPWLLIFGFLWFFVFRTLRQSLAARKEPLRVVIVAPETR